MHIGKIKCLTELERPDDKRQTAHHVWKHGVGEGIWLYNNYLTCVSKGHVSCLLLPVALSCFLNTIVVIQSLSPVQLFATPWTGAHQASSSFTISWSLLRFMSIELVMPSSHLMLLSPPSPVCNLSQHKGLFQWVGSSHQVAKVLELQLQHQSLQYNFWI